MYLEYRIRYFLKTIPPKCLGDYVELGSVKKGLNQDL